MVLPEGCKPGRAYKTFRDYSDAEFPHDWKSVAPKAPSATLVRWCKSRDIAYIRSRAAQGEGATA